jgi:hypothetical protein
MVVSTAAAFLFAAVFAGLPLAAQQGQGQAVVTVLPHNKEAAPMNVTDQDLAVHVNGKLAKVTGWTPASDSTLELVVLIDGSSRTSLGRQFGDIEQFVRALPPNVQAAIAYMDQGRADFVAPFSADHALVLRNLHLPGGMAGTDASPYFCLSYLAKNWPSQNVSARREVIMITDGVDRYELRYDPEDQYLQAAITDAARAHLVVYSIYWSGQGQIDATGYENNAGQNLLQQLSEGTGGKSYWIGSGNPVSFQPYFDEMLRRFQNQYELGVTAPLRGKAELETMKLKLSAPGAEVDAPNEVYITPGQP